MAFSLCNSSIRMHSLANGRSNIGPAMGGLEACATHKSPTSIQFIAAAPIMIQKQSPGCTCWGLLNVFSSQEQIVLCQKSSKLCPYVGSRKINIVCLGKCLVGNIAANFRIYSVHSFHLQTFVCPLSHTHMHTHLKFFLEQHC